MNEPRSPLSANFGKTLDQMRVDVERFLRIGFDLIGLVITSAIDKRIERHITQDPDGPVDFFKVNFCPGYGLDYNGTCTRGIDRLYVCTQLTIGT